MVPYATPAMEIILDIIQLLLNAGLIITGIGICIDPTITLRKGLRFCFGRHTRVNDHAR